MMPMMISPPERSALRGGGSPQGEKELADPAGAVSFMGEVPVVDAGDSEHADEIKRDRGADRKGTPTGPDHGKTCEV